MIDRRQFLGTIPATAVAFGATAAFSDDSQPKAPDFGTPIASPPVVQNPRPNGFGISIAINALATAWVEYGFDRNDLPFVAKASHHGLIAADDRVLHVRVNHPGNLPAARPVFYRVVVQPLQYVSAYKLERGEPQATAIHELRLPSTDMRRLRVVSINDTHENLATLQQLHPQIEQLQPDLLIWNGDTCNDFNPGKAPEQLLLNPAQDVTQGWAVTRPLLFSNGNHDVRGRHAREVSKSMAGCPESAELPYCQALRYGPLAIVTLDTGEDKPDHHPVFAGTASYEPYREQQATWLKEVVSRPEIASAPFKLAICHIPLRGLDGQPDGTTLDDYARYSGFGTKLWLPTLKTSGFHAILSGHMHSHRHDLPTEDMPVHQFVGGGPKPENATLTIVDVQQSGQNTETEIRINDLSGTVHHRHQWTA